MDIADITLIVNILLAHCISSGTSHEGFHQLCHTAHSGSTGQHVDGVPAVLYRMSYYILHVKHFLLSRDVGYYVLYL